MYTCEEKQRQKEREKERDRVSVASVETLLIWSTHTRSSHTFATLGNHMCSCMEDWPTAPSPIQNARPQLSSLGAGLAQVRVDLGRNIWIYPLAQIPTNFRKYWIGEVWTPTSNGGPHSTPRIYFIFRLRIDFVWWAHAGGQLVSKIKLWMLVLHSTVSCQP